MKNKFIIKKKITNKIINYSDIKNKKYFFNINLNEIFGEILEIDKKIEINKDENNIYLNDEKICSFTIDDNCMLYKTVIKIMKDDILYKYDVNENQECLMVMLNSCSFTKNEVNYSIERCYSKYFVDIRSKNKGIYLVLEDNLNDEFDIVGCFSEINICDNIKDIYNKVNKKFNIFNNITIRKYNILNTVDSKEINTDLIIIENGCLIDYLTTIEKLGKKYVIKKDNNNYSITLLNSSIDGLLSTYFDLNEQVKFVKKLENHK